MELQAEQQCLLEGYLGHFGSLIGDKRTEVTFGETVKGIIGSGRLVCQQIAAHGALDSSIGSQRRGSAGDSICHRGEHAAFTGGRGQSDGSPA